MKKLNFPKIRNILAWLRITKKWRRVLISLGFAGLLLVALFGLHLYQNHQAETALHAATSLDDQGKYGDAKKTLDSVNKTLVSATVTHQIASEMDRNQKLTDTQRKLDEAKRLLQQNKPGEAQKILQDLQASLPSGNNQSSSSQIAALQHSATQGTSSSSKSQNASSGSGGQSSGGGSSSGSGGGGGSGGSSSGGGTAPPPPGPLTSISVASFTASSSSATASTCNITDSLTFSVNGSGTVSTTWSLFSTKTSSQTNNPTNFTFSAAGNQSDSFNFSGTQGLEAGDSYRVSATITSTSNPAITTTAGPITISSCAAPPALAAEQMPAYMTSITPGTPTLYQAHDGVFPNECSVQVTTPYSVNSSGTVEAIVMVTSGSSIGYTYYDKNGATAFSGSGSTSDTSYFRLPHLPGGGQYTVMVKLVEVSSPGSVYATTISQSMGCS